GAAEALSCNHCLSSDSMDDCNEQQKQKRCPANQDRCSTLTVYHEGPNTFLKDCIPERLCSTYCKGGVNSDGYECELSCCEGNLCN
ncbi:hypothetical protein OS493_003418, partial [Desmophyllum pertusum]